MKLTGGDAAGANLFGRKGRETRPAQARVRNSLFNILQADVPGSRVLDLFAGTGSVGLETLSRGAASCVFVDQSRECVDLIRRNVEKLRWSDRASVRKASCFRVEQYLPDPNEVFDLVFVDPPYAMVQTPKDREALIHTLHQILAQGHLAPDALLVMENPTGHGLTDAELPGMTCFDRRQYHQTELSFFRKLESSADHRSPRQPAT